VALSADSALDILGRYWGYDGFRPAQREIIDSVLSGSDTLGLLPTGGGKSLTFQVPAMMLPGLTVVVTPLISLMKDQVDNLRRRGVRAAYLHSGLSRAERRLAMDRAVLGKIKLLYVSPEKLMAPQFVGSLRDAEVSLIVVDEAHCISQWGYDFRPSYLKIAGLRDEFPEAPMLALTASATPEVAADIMERLRFRNGRMFRRSFARPNISYVVRHGENKPEQLVRILAAVGGSAIVYARSRRRCREYADMLRAAGIGADFYHAGLAPEDKDEKQARWTSGAVRVMVATTAFGMGIDKPDVRTVVHVDLPSSLEEYYQEAGRAGRDGLPSFAVTLVGPRDRATLRRRLSTSFPPKDFIVRVYELACNFMDVAVGAGYNTVCDFNFALFCERFRLPPAPTRSALNLLTRAGYFEYQEQADARARVMVVADKAALYDLQVSPAADKVMQHVLRSCTGVFADYVDISEESVARHCGLSADEVYQALLELTRQHAVHYVPRRMNPYVYFTASRVLPKHVSLPRAVYEEMRDRMAARIRSVERFAWGDSECRASAILIYFGEEPDGDCGCCDVCRAHRRSSAPSATERELLRDSILYVAARPGGVGLDTLLDEVGGKRRDVIAAIRSLIDESQLTLNDNTISLCKRH